MEIFAKKIDYMSAKKLIRNKILEYGIDSSWEGDEDEWAWIHYNTGWAHRLDIARIENCCWIRNGYGIKLSDNKNDFIICEKNGSETTYKFDSTPDEFNLEWFLRYEIEVWGDIPGFRDTFLNLSFQYWIDKWEESSTFSEYLNSDEFISKEDWENIIHSEINDICINARYYDEDLAQYDKVYLEEKFNTAKEAFDYSCTQYVFKRITKGIKKYYNKTMSEYKYSEKEFDKVFLDVSKIQNNRKHGRLSSFVFEISWTGLRTAIKETFFEMLKSN